MGVMETTKEIQDQVVDTVSTTQETVVETVRNFTESAEGPVVDLSAVPGIENVPTAKEIVDNLFDFTAKVVDTSREFVSGLVDAVTPLVGRGAEEKTETRKATAKSTKPS